MVSQGRKRKIFTTPPCNQSNKDSIDRKTSALIFSDHITKKIAKSISFIPLFLRTHPFIRESILRMTTLWIITIKSINNSAIEKLCMTLFWSSDNLSKLWLKLIHTCNWWLKRGILWDSPSKRTHEDRLICWINSWISFYIHYFFPTNRFTKIVFFW